MGRRPPSDRPRRRHVLRAAVTFATAAIAGCAGGPAGDAGGTTDDPNATTDGPVATTTGSPTATTTTGSEATVNSVTGGEKSDGEEPDGGESDDGTLDLREANVVGVEIAGREDGYEFSVTLYHDDDGEDGYANWWQVETVEGERLGRRELLHAHGTSPFTRSGTIDVPDGVTCVVVRGHDQTHGYGGQAMLVNVETGATAATRQGSESSSVDGERCP